MAAQVAKEWSDLVEAGRSQPVVTIDLDRKTLVSMAGEMCEAEMAAHENTAGPADQWRKKFMAIQRALILEERDEDRPRR